MANALLFAARGELFSLPAENGFVKDLTQTPGVAERSPQWSPDGNSIVYWSDASGEYELYLTDASKEKPAKKLTSYGAGFRYTPYWSPDSKKVAFIDKAMNIQVFDLQTNKTTQVDKGLRMTHGALDQFICRWSPDSRWLTYSRDLENQHDGVFLYDYNQKQLYPVSSGFYDCSSPVFDADGKYLFLTTNQSFSPNYSNIDNTFIYANTTQLAAISLLTTTPSLLYPKNDEVGIKSSEEKQKADSLKKVLKEAGVIANKKTVATIPDIDVANMESRMILLPAKPGNYGLISAVKGKIIYLQRPNTGTTEGKSTLKFYDIEKREEKTILDDVNDYIVSADGKKILVRRKNAFTIISAEENQKFDNPLRIAEMQMKVDPQQEWRQIFMDAWRLERDYFYDPNMHGVNWNGVKERYLPMLEAATSREEVNIVLGDMIGELNASHTYNGGGDGEEPKSTAVGYIGIDWQAAGDYYKIKEIIAGAPWDAEVRSPLQISGSDIKKGRLHISRQRYCINN